MNRIKFNRLFLNLTLICIAANLVAQNNDFSIWTGLSLKKELSDKLEISLDNEIRFYNNASSVDKVYTQPGISYSIIKPLEFAFYYRYRKTNEITHFVNQHGIRADLSYKKDINRVDISYRTRFQSKYSEYFSSEDGKIPSNYFRNKISASYDIRKSPYKPSISYEIFYPLNNPEIKAFDKVRYIFGISYSVNKQLDLNLLYQLIKEFNTSNPQSNNVIALRLEYSL